MSTVNNTVWEEDHSTTGKPGNLLNWRPSHPWSITFNPGFFRSRSATRDGPMLHWRLYRQNRTLRSTACTWQTTARATALKLIH